MCIYHIRIKQRENFKSLNFGQSIFFTPKHFIILKTLKRDLFGHFMHEKNHHANGCATDIQNRQALCEKGVLGA